MTAAAKLENRQSRLLRNLPLFVTVICALQPLMDVLSFWQSELGMDNTLTLALRFGVLAVVALMGFCLSRQKSLYSCRRGLRRPVGRALLCQPAERLSQPLSDVINYVRVIQMPLFAVCFITFMKRNDRCFEGIKRGFAVNFLIITGVLILSLLTGTCRPTYDLSWLGLMGWFSTSNAQSAIVSMLTPVVVWMAYESKRTWLVWITVAAAYPSAVLHRNPIGLCRHAGYDGGPCLYVSGHAACGMEAGGGAVCGVGYRCRVYEIRPHVQKSKLLFRLYLDQQGYVAEEMMEKMPELEEGVDFKELFKTLTDAEKRYVLAPIYAFYSNDLCRRFTVNTVIEAYDYTYAVSDLTNARNHKITYCKLLQQEHPEAVNGSVWSWAA